MELLPAVDVLGASAVRLVQGDYAQISQYGDPIARAAAYAAGGASWVHVVDLAAARSGEPTDAALVAALVEAVTPHGTRIEIGGGIRNAARAEALLAAGVTRIVLGTAALEEPALVERLAVAHPGRVAVGLDHRRLALQGGGPHERVVAVAGWQRQLPLSLLEAASRFSALPLGALVVTDITRDGILAGPDLEGYAELLATTELPVVASGGVSTPSDLEALASLEVGGRRLAGAIVGKALLDGRMSLDEALAACAAPGAAAAPAPRRG
ncbi:MAG TPA: HisA/HisF-related TIM barrel protein [Acidimicrobiales bacterium]|nr:HisA/HisF-related TIM barrel protein [Acidimicrobiales bacterium]